MQMQVTMSMPLELTLKLLVLQELTSLAQVNPVAWMLMLATMLPLLLRYPKPNVQQEHTNHQQVNPVA